MSPPRKSTILLLQGLLLLVAGCEGGGGGGGDGTRVEPPPQLSTGTLAGGPFAGVRYATETQHGETDEDGQYRYVAGETITFSVGDILLGSAEAADTITPFDLAGGGAPVSRKEILLETQKMASGERATTLEIAANLAVFLQSVDADGDLDNGVQVPSRLHEIARGMELDFSVDCARFRSGFEFRRLMGDGRNAGLWGGERAIRRTAYALDDLYRRLGITPEIIEATLIRTDVSDDGTVDSVRFRSFDDDGNVTRTENDNDGDGAIDEYWADTYDLRGNVIVYERDDSRVGSPRETNAFDGSGNLVRYEMRIVDSVTNLIEWEYDAYANPTAEIRSGDRKPVTWSYAYAPDNSVQSIGAFDPGGSLIFRYEYSHDDSGYSERYTHPAGHGWDASYSIETRYNELGDIVVFEEDGGDDGIVDTRGRYTYAAEGYSEVYEKYGVSGETVVRVFTQYDPDGRLVKLERDEPVNGVADGVIDYRIQNEYDSAGRKVLQKTDRDGDGPNGPVTNLWVYDDAANIVEASFDAAGDGVIDSRTISSYDDDGFLVLVEEDRNNDGVADAKTSYAHTKAVTGRWAAYFPAPRYCYRCEGVLPSLDQEIHLR